MQTFLATLQSLGLYLGVIVLGAVIGSRRAVRAKKLAWLGKFQSVALVLLILMLGVEIGSDEQVISSLGAIGVSALAITLLALAGSVLAVVLARKLLKLDRRGRTAEQRAEAEAREGGNAV